MPSPEDKTPEDRLAEALRDAKIKLLKVRPALLLAFLQEAMTDIGDGNDVRPTLAPRPFTHALFHAALFVVHTRCPNPVAICPTNRRVP